MYRVLIIIAASLLIHACAEGNNTQTYPDGAVISDVSPQTDMSFDGYQLPDQGWTPPPDTLPWPDAPVTQNDMHYWVDSAILDKSVQDGPSSDAAGACPDQYEPNETCLTGEGLGTTGEGSTWVEKNATLNPGSDLDWFFAVGEESASFCLPGTSQCFRFTVKVQVPAGREFKLCVLEGPCSATSVCADNDGIPGPLQLEVQYDVAGTCALADDTTARISLEQLDGSGDCVPYTISFNYDVC